MRAILRNYKCQKNLEKRGYVLTQVFSNDFFCKIKKVTSRLGEDWNTLDAQNTFSDILNSKLEYLFLNFYPILYSKISFSGSTDTLQSANPICNENIEMSVSLFIPYPKNDKTNSVIKILRNGHLLNNFPRSNFMLDISRIHLSNIQNVIVKPNEALILYNNVPYSVASDTIFMKIDMIGYEGKLVLFNNFGTEYVGHRVSPERFLKYKLEGKIDELMPSFKYKLSEPMLDLSMYQKGNFWKNVKLFFSEIKII